MTEGDRDALFGRLFATEDGKILIRDLARRSHLLTAGEIRERVGRMRRLWETGNPKRL